MSDAAGATGVPMAFGVLTTDSVEQAVERAARTGQQGARSGAGGDRDGALFGAEAGA